jgi:hypothetical protein
MKRLGFTFKELYESIIEDNILLEGLQYTHYSNVTLTHIIQEFGNILLGKYCRSSADLKSTSPKEFIDLVHLVPLADNEELRKRMKFFGYHYSITKLISPEEMEFFKFPSKYKNVYVSTFEGTYPTLVERNNLPRILYHVTLRKNAEEIKKRGLLTKASKTSFDHPSNRIYLFATVNPSSDLPKLIRILAKNKKEVTSEYVILKIVDYYPTGEKFFLDPSMDIGDVSNTCRGIFVHRAIHPKFID